MVNDARVKVVQIIPDLGGGGAERTLLNLATQLDPERFSVTVVSLFPKSDTSIEGELARHAVPVLHLNKHPGLDLAMFWRIHKVLHRLRPQIVHSHRYVLQYALPAIVANPHCHFVHTIHSLASNELPAHARFANRLAFKLGVSPVAIGPTVSSSIWRAYGIAARAVIPNGIPVLRCQSPAVDRETWRRNLGLRDDVLLFVSVARLSPPKNIERLLRAFALVERDRASLLLVGDGPLRSKLENLVVRLGLGASVRFLGSRSDIPEILSASDVFVFSSDWEGNPLAVMEAMAAGLPVVSTRVGGIPEMVSDGETGLLVDAQGELPLARAMSLAMGDRSLRARLGRAARERASREFDNAVMARRYASLYGALLAHGSSDCQP